MPNHMTNVVIFTSDNKESIDNLIQTVKMDDLPEGSIDFNKVIPEPSNCYHGDLSDEDRKKYKCNWYDFHLKNWGTKWNSYGYDYFKGKSWPKFSDIMINAVSYWQRTRFQTAWTVPVPIYKKLSEMFPDVGITVMYADEDTGNDCGIITFKNGEVAFDTPFEDGSKEAYDLYFDVNGVTPEKEGYVFDKDKNTYVWNYKE